MKEEIKNKIRLTAGGMTCGKCVSNVKIALQEVNKVSIYKKCFC
ncbi:hypothetical protein [Clostridium sp. UBA1056]